ncbi:MAG: MFS transporter, partial [Alphaproteobacteria bacterium]|nr:MFS transporter [Alphaproteobacteria bacterium]
FANTGIGALLPATIAFFLLSLPIMLLYKEDRKIMRSAEDAIEKIDFSKLKRLFAVPGVAAALLSFFFFNDALVSIMNNLSIYTKQVFGATEAQTILLVVGVSVFSAIGALIGGRLGDRVGPRSMIIAGLAAWTLLLVAFALAPTFIMACFITAALGLFLGALWTNSRAYMASVLPKKDLAYGFSFYVIFERFSSIWGPLTWGLIIAFSGSYRLAVGVLAISTLLGIAAMFYRVNPNKKIATMK